MMIMSKKALWSGRFENEMDESVLVFTSSLEVDSAFAFYDVMGSLAHVRMLKKCKIIPDKDADKIIKGLISIVEIMEKEEFEVDGALEDIHTNIEVKLTEMIGPVGGKLHTGRSRNDQVSTDLRMYLRDVVLEVVTNIDNLIMDLLDVAKEYREAIIPGFTHMQHAQPVTVAQHMLAHAFRLSRDADRFLDAWERMNKCPLGSAALAGTTYPIDRAMTAQALGFKAPTENSMDSVSSRDNVTELLFCASATALDLSSISEELVLWSSQEFGFIRIADTYSTGSSIMPQKKNPDLAELIRGRTGMAVGNLVSTMVMMKGLPLSYNRDLQEDKKPVMDSLEMLLDCTEMMSKMISTMTFNTGRMLDATSSGFINATDLADYLVVKGIPFREAHAIVGEAVRYCIDKGKKLEDLDIEELQKFSSIIGNDVYDILPIRCCVERRTTYGGTSSLSTDAQIVEAMALTMERENILRQETQLIESCWDELLERN